MKPLPLLLTCTLLIAPTALAAERVPGTWTYYSVSADQITDVNTSFVIVDEVNDTTGDTSLTFRCSDRDRANLWAMLSSKNPLLSPTDEILPTATVRVGSGTPQTVYGEQLYSTSTPNGNTDPSTIGLPAGVTREMAAGLFRGERVVVRLQRDPAVGSQVLTYTFPADGFKTAWNAVNRCQSGRPATTTTSATASAPRTSGGSASSDAPRLTSWYFTTCTDTESGVARSNLRAGQTHRCQLVIETIPNGAVPTNAVFTYELEYLQGGRSGKLTLDTRDVWQAGIEGSVLHRVDGNRLIFNLPLNVRLRPDRRYTSINVTAKVTFSGGDSKKVYEKLPVTQ